MKNWIVYFSLLFLFAFNGSGQDIHWSQYYDNPIFLNPSEAGNFKGDLRFIANYRDQWRSVTVPFQTSSFSLDGRLANFRDLGWGILVFHDVVGDGQLRTLEFQANANLPLYLKSDSSVVLRNGINIGMNQRSLNSQAFFFDNQFNGTIFDPNLPTNETFAAASRTNLSIGIGTVLDWQLSKKNQLSTGFGVFNLNRPNQGFFGVPIQRDIRAVFHGRLTHKIKSDLFLLPSFNLGIQGKYRALELGTSMKYVVVDKLGVYRTVHAGLFYRTKDAAFITLGMDYQNWFVGVSYDVNLSQLTQASNARGGLEIAVRYIYQSLKPKKIVHRICPDYI